MNDRLIVSRRAQLRTASQPTVKGQLPQWVAERLPALPAPSQQRDPDPVTWRLAMGLLRVPGFDLPKRPRRNRGGPYRFDLTCGDGDARQSAGFWSEKPMSIPFWSDENAI
jgi:hypothetical protein